jgi:hypothetical protein
MLCPPRNFSRKRKKVRKTTAPRCSRILTNYSTNEALASLTLEIKRDPVHYGRYGRSYKGFILANIYSIDPLSQVKQRTLPTYCLWFYLCTIMLMLIIVTPNSSSVSHKPQTDSIYPPFFRLHLLLQSFGRFRAWQFLTCRPDSFLHTVIACRRDGFIIALPTYQSHSKSRGLRYSNLPFALTTGRTPQISLSSVVIVSLFL